MRKGFIGLACLSFLVLCVSFANSPKFYPDDPLWIEPEVLISMPSPRGINEAFNFLKNAFSRSPSERPPRAMNVNTVGGVPDSSWYTNRLSRRPMTLEELRRGPNQVEAPAAPFTIVAPKAEGATPGFRMTDARGDLYFVKLDPVDNPQMATSAEVISTKFLHAFGYHVPENFLVLAHPDRLQIDSEARINDGRRERQMVREDLYELLEGVARQPDGTVQLMASRGLPGTILGPFTYWGTRPDDANDIVPHQHRRELRALRVFASWLNHVDVDAMNSLDVFLETGSGEQKELGHVRHYLIDMGSTLGSAGHAPHAQWAGYEHQLDLDRALKRAVTLGLWEASWQDVDYPAYPSIGRFSAEAFDPETWTPYYPNPAFNRMRLADALWACNMLAKFDRPSIEAVVATGQLVNSQAEDFLIDTLVKRRNRILQHYLARINPIVRFEVGEKGRLRFVNLADEEGLRSPSSYRYRWFSFDNQTDERTALGPFSVSQEATLPIPAYDTRYLMLRIETMSHDFPEWQKAVEVYVRNGSPGKVVGIDRQE